MPQFDSGGVSIKYEIHGEGQPFLLIHGFASNGRVNWVDTGWVNFLQDAGYMPVTIDNRGHGESEKLYDPHFYSPALMASDAHNLIKHLQLGQVPVMGYSMGARISAYLGLNHADSVSAIILGGLGIHLLRGLHNADEIIAGLTAQEFSDIPTKDGRLFRRFAESTGSDLKALAACMASIRPPVSREQLNRLTAPVLVAVGDKDDVGGAAEPLAELLPNGEAFVIKGRDHMLATGDKTYKSAVVEFLSRLPK